MVYSWSVHVTSVAYRALYMGGKYDQVGTPPFIHP